MPSFIEAGDLDAFADIAPTKAQAMIDDAVSMAVLVAPCLGDDDTVLTDPQRGAVRAVLRGAILRWNEAGTGALQQQTAGPFSQTVDTRNQRKGLFTPDEIGQLQSVCASGVTSGAFSIDTVPDCSVIHADICTLNFGGLYCSCGAVLAGLPLWETGYGSSYY